MMISVSLENKFGRGLLWISLLVIFFPYFLVGIYGEFVTEFLSLFFLFFLLVVLRTNCFRKFALKDSITCRRFFNGVLCCMLGIFFLIQAGLFNWLSILFTFPIIGLAFFLLQPINFSDKRLANLFFYLTAVFAVINVIMIFHQIVDIDVYPSLDAGRGRGFFRGTLNCSFILAVSFCVLLSSNFNPRCLALLLGLVGVGIILTGSRGSILSVVLAFSVWYLSSRGWKSVVNVPLRSFMLKSVLVTLLIILLFLAVSAFRDLSVFELSSGDLNRLDSYLRFFQDGLALWYGVGSTGAASSRIMGIAGGYESAIFNFASEYTLIGVLFFLSAFWSRDIFKDPNVLAFLVCTIVLGVFQITLQTPSNLAFTFLSAHMISNFGNKKVRSCD